MCVQLRPGMGPGAVEAFGAGLAAGVAEVAADDLCEAAVEEVEALAMLTPSARPAPSAAAPTAVPMSGLVILTRFSFRWCPPGTGPAGPVTRAPRLLAGAGRVIPCSAGRLPGAGPVARQFPVRQTALTGPCVPLLSSR